MRNSHRRWFWKMLSCKIFQSVTEILEKLVCRSSHVSKVAGCRHAALLKLNTLIGISDFSLTIKKKTFLGCMYIRKSYFEQLLFLIVVDGSSNLLMRKIDLEIIW